MNKNREKNIKLYCHMCYLRPKCCFISYFCVKIDIKCPKNAIFSIIFV